MRPSSVTIQKAPISKSEASRLRNRIVGEQTWRGVLIGSAIGAAAGATVYLAIWTLIVIPLIALFVPGLVSGYIAKLTARAYEAKYRATCGLVTFAALVAAGLYVDLNPMVLLVALSNALIVIALSRRKLTKEEEHAIYRYRMGLDA